MQLKTKLVERWWHLATGPVIIIVVKKVGSTAFSATSRGRRSTSTCGAGEGKGGKGVEEEKG